LRASSSATVDVAALRAKLRERFTLELGARVARLASQRLMSLQSAARPDE
jgi:hypothetical protein